MFSSAVFFIYLFCLSHDFLSVPDQILMIRVDCVSVTHGSSVSTSCHGSRASAHRLGSVLRWQRGNNPSACHGAALPSGILHPSARVISWEHEDESVKAVVDICLSDRQKLHDRKVDCLILVLNKRRMMNLCRKIHPEQQNGKALVVTHSHQTSFHFFCVSSQFSSAAHSSLFPSLV